MVPTWRWGWTSWPIILCCSRWIYHGMGFADASTEGRFANLYVKAPWSFVIRVWIFPSGPQTVLLRFQEDLWFCRRLWSPWVVLCGSWLQSIPQEYRRRQWVMGFCKVQAVVRRMRAAVIVRMWASVVVRMSSTLKTGSNKWHLPVKMDVYAFLQLLICNLACSIASHCHASKVGSCLLSSIQQWCCAGL